MNDPTTAAYADRLDAADSLSSYRDRFVGSESDLVYFDGNSLGRPLRVTADRMGTFVAEEWGGRLIRAWDEQWMDLPLGLGDEIAHAMLGAAPGQTVVADAVTTLLYKLVRGAVDLQRRRDPARTEIVIDRDNFPTDRYVVEGIAAECGLTVRWVDVALDSGIDADQLAGVVGPETSLVLFSHVAYRSAHLADARAVTRLAHEAGALVLWDLCHSVGAVPVELDAWEVDLAVGCTYKYLNGGPGSPGFAYVAARHQDELAQPIHGWLGNQDPFLMGPEFRPAKGMRRFISSSPSILAMQPVRDMVALVADAGIDAIRAKSLALTSYALELQDALLAPLGVVVATPREPHRRGGHVTVSHPAMREVTARLWEQDVIPDYRDPGGLRIGLSPLSTSFDEVRRGMVAVRDVLAGL